MIRHLLRIAWRRRRVNALVAAEITVTFLVVSLLATIGVQFAMNARLPLGFRHDDVWVVTFGRDRGHQDWTEEDARTVAAMLDAAREVPGVVSAAAISSAPYDYTENNWQLTIQGRPADVSFDAVTDGAADVLGLQLVEGRWFDPADDDPARRLIVVNRELARRLVPGGSAIGAAMPRDPGDPEMRVIGVVSEFRSDGELSSPRPHFFVRKPLDRAVPGIRLENLVLRLQPGTPATAEPALLERLRPEAPGWQMEATTLTSMRRVRLASGTAPLIAGSVVAGFLILMVALGLTGVLWQAVTRRTREFALRRAVGATAGDVRRQVLGELLVVAGAAVAVGALVAAQVPMLGVFPDLRAGSQAAGLALAAAFILGVVLASGLYPASLAMRASPAEALRSE